jgi:hypothetical protein
MFSMRLALCLTAGAMLAASAARGESYHLVDQRPYGTLFIDGATVQPTAAGRQAWATFFLAKDGDGSTITQGVAFMMTLDEYDCSGNRTRHLYLQTYNSHGEPVEKTPGAQPWEVVVPGSNAAVEGHLVCDDEFRRRDQDIKAGPLEMLKAVRAPSKPG